MARILTGIQSTGVPHLGNILGAILPAIEESKHPENDSFLFIANLHTLTQIKDCLPSNVSTSTSGFIEAKSFHCILKGFRLNLPPFSTVVVAQLVELQIVVLAVVGSSPIDHPKALLGLFLFSISAVITKGA